MNCVGSRQIEPIRRQPADSRASENDAQHATREADEHTLCDLLTDEAHAAASQRRAHGHLLAASDCPGNQQIRQVQAGDEQQTEDGDHQHIERSFGVAYDVLDERKRNDRRGHWAVAAEASKDSVLNRAYFLGGTAQGNTGPEARDHVACMAVMAMQDNRRNSFVVRNPQLNLRIGISKPLWEHTNDRIRLAIEADASFR